MKHLRVVFEPDEEGWWAVSIPELKGVRSDGRTLEECRRKIREALASATDLGWTDAKAESAVFDEDVRLGADIDALLRDRVSALDALIEAGAAVDRLTVEAVHRLSGELGRSLRDIAPLLGLSHGRVHQILGEPRENKGRDRRTSSNRVTVAREQPAVYRVRRRGRK